MLVGWTPFDGTSIVEIFEAHLNDLAKPPAEIVRDCPEDLSDLVMLLLEKSPEDRPDNASAVQAALADILHNRPMRLEPRSADELAADLAATVRPEAPNLTARLQTGKPATQSLTALWIWLGLGVVAVSVFAAILVFFRQ